MIEVFGVYSLFGWAGVFLIILSYILFSTRRLKIDYALYHILNFVGAVGLIVSTFITQSWPALTLALIFAGISVAYMLKIFSIKPKYRDLRN